MAAIEFVIGRRTSQFVGVSLVGQSTDEGWNSAIVEAKFGGFVGRVATSVMNGELTPFVVDLERLYRELNGAAELTLLDGNLSVTIRGDGSGRLTVSGVVADSSNELQFYSDDYDQTYLPDLIDELRAIISA